LCLCSFGLSEASTRTPYVQSRFLSASCLGFLLSIFLCMVSSYAHICHLLTSIILHCLHTLSFYQSTNSIPSSESSSSATALYEQRIMLPVALDSTGALQILRQRFQRRQGAIVIMSANQHSLNQHGTTPCIIPSHPSPIPS
jgi:hypothetical protein